MSCGVLNAGYSYLFGFLMIVIGYQFYKNRDVSLNFLQKPEIWILLSFGITYVLFDELTGTNLQNYLLLPVMAYIIGWTCNDLSENPSDGIKNCVVALTLGFGTNVVLNYFANIGHTRYQLVEFWTGQVRAATGSGFLNTFIVSLVLYTIIYEKRIWLKIILSVLTVFSLLYMFMLGTRTQFIVLFVVLIVGVLVYMYQKHKMLGVFKSLMIFTICTAVILCMYIFNVFHLADFINSSNIANRYYDKVGLSHSNQGRIEAFIEGVQGLFLYPFGGLHSESYRHNMWLDIGRVSGLIPFIIMIVFSCITFNHMLKMFKNRNSDSAMRFLILCLYIGVMINFFVEPIMEGLLNFFLGFCVVNGMIDCYYYKNISPYVSQRTLITTENKTFMRDDKIEND